MTIKWAIFLANQNSLYLRAMYNVEEYWSEVADRIDDRDGKNVIAGDDEPYYRLKRRKFLQLFKEIDYSGKTVLEIGPGPGGNLKEVSALNPAKLVGADISQNMIDLARQNVPESTELVKTNGKVLPFSDESFDIVYSVTVLQHNTDEENLKQLMAEMARVSRAEVHLYERIEKSVKGDKLNFGRPIAYYADFFRSHGFELANTKFLNIQASYALAGFSRKYLNPKTRVEGEPLSKSSLMLQKFLMPLTRALDAIIPQKRDLARLRFVRQ